VPDQKIGALLMLLSIVVWFFIPWLDRSPVRSVRYRSWPYKFFLAIFTVSFLALMYLGMKPAEDIYVTLARIFMGGYFAFFVLMPFYTRWGQPKAVPQRVTFHG
jgi:ubiquinol-cytochrome c reductase cytochrome b subunit